jgi:hypothetical protein
VKAVVYHADAHFAWGGEVGKLYKQLFERFVKMCHLWKIEVIHLTLEGCPGWGDENKYYPDLKINEPMYNRELLFCEFLENAPDDVYWFAEPDFHIFKMWPPLTTDCALLFRAGDAVAMCPAWRMANRKAIPLFREFRDVVKNVQIRPGVGRDWHCDSDAFNIIYEKMGRPKDRTNYLGVDIEFRTYADYVKNSCKFTKNYTGNNKKGQLLKIPIDAKRE